MGLERVGYDSMHQGLDLGALTAEAPGETSYFPDASTPLQTDGERPVQATLHARGAVMVLSRPPAYPPLTVTK